MNNKHFTVSSNHYLTNTTGNLVMCRSNIQYFQEIFFAFLLSIDATTSKTKGRFINDEWINPNAVVKKVIVKNIPRLGVFAKEYIASGKEIRFDYGQPAPWRRQVRYYKVTGISGYT